VPSSAWDYVGTDLDAAQVSPMRLPEHEEEPTVEIQAPAVTGFDSFMMY
jgi:hypothetical protein